MLKGVTGKVFLAIACLGICLAFVPSAQGATVFANCAALNGASNDIKIQPGISPGTGKQPINAGDDVVVNCFLEGRTVTIQAHSIAVNGPIGGIHTTGIGGMRLFADLNSSGTKCAGDLTATTATITINGATLQDDNDNGNITLRSCWDITFTAPSNVSSADAQILAECLWPETPPSPFVSPYGCQVKATGSTFPSARHIYFFSQGDMTLADSVFATHSPLDNMRFVSIFGNLFAGESGCDPNQPLQCPNPFTIADACNLCQLCHPTHNSFSGGVESNAFFFAEQDVDLSGACVNIAENITITADGRSPVSPYNVLAPTQGPGAAFYINLQDAQIRDDFGKTGNIAILALPPLKGNPGHPLQWDEVIFNPGNNPVPYAIGTGPIWYQDAILIDDGENGGGTDPAAVSFMNGYRDIIEGACSQWPTCINRAIPVRTDNAHPGGIIADPLKRVQHFVSGTPKCDS